MMPVALRKPLIRLMAGKQSPLRFASRRFRAGIFKLDRLGDFVLALGAIRALTRHYGEDQCALIVFQEVGELARLEFPQAAVMELPADGGGIRNALPLWWSHRRSLSNLAFEDLICLRHHRALVHHLVLSWVSAGRSIGMANSTLSQLEADEKIWRHELTEELPQPPQAPSGSCLELEAHRLVVERVVEAPVNSETILPRFMSFETKAGDSILVNPYASRAIRDYPEAQMLAVLKEVTRATNSPLVLCGGPSERGRLQQLAQRAWEKNIGGVEVLRACSFLDFCGTVAHCRGVLTVDTSTAHVATALNKPTVVVMGGGHYGVFGPWQRSAKQVWLTNPLPCFHCDWHCVHPKPLCITEIPPSQIAAQLLKVI